MKRNFSDYFIGANPKGEQVEVHGIVLLLFIISYKLSGDVTYNGSC